MSDDDSNSGKSEAERGRQRANSEEVCGSGSFTGTTDEKAGEVTDPGDPPEDGYTFAPSPSNQNPDGDSSNGGDSGSN